LNAASCLLIHSEQEIVCYLAYIKDVWLKILHHSKQAIQMVDETTVTALELMALRNSIRDAQKLYKQLASSEIFALFSVQDQEMIWTELYTIDGLIPSLATFFKDLKYLQACAGSMRHLVELTPKDTMRTALDGIFTVLDERVIQQAESIFDAQLANDSDAWYLAYRQL
jgi:hypothetical protein